MFFQTFNRYLAYEKDTDDLLMFILKQLVSDSESFYRTRYGHARDYVEVSEKELAERVSNQALTARVFKSNLKRLLSVAY